MGDTLKSLKAWSFSRDYITHLFHSREYITGVYNLSILLTNVYEVPKVCCQLMEGLCSGRPAEEDTLEA